MYEVTKMGAVKKAIDEIRKERSADLKNRVEKFYYKPHFYDAMYEISTAFDTLETELKIAELYLQVDPNASFADETLQEIKKVRKALDILKQDFCEDRYMEPMPETKADMQAFVRKYKKALGSIAKYMRQTWVLGWTIGKARQRLEVIDSFRNAKYCTDCYGKIDRIFHKNDW